jgi:uncharacterized protein involved in response to NO
MIEIPITSATQAARIPTHKPIWNLGFRPFYLAGALWAAIAIPIWVMQWQGVLTTKSHLTHSAWHMHEMIFGYAFAIIAGFLLTAVKVWTGRDVPTGRRLMLIFACWLAARVFYLTSFSWLGIVAESLFFALTAWGIAKPIWQSNNRQNLIFVWILVLAGLLNGVFHAALLGANSTIDYHLAAVIGLDVVSLVIVVVSGRVMPMFTRNGAPGTQPKSFPLLEKITLIAILLTLSSNIAGSYVPPNSSFTALPAAMTSMLLLIRWLLCSPFATWRNPILWSLHAALIWLPIGYFLRAYAAIDASIPATLGIHALTIGVVGGLTLSMMTRTARGHTGHALLASPRETFAYIVIMLAVMIRVATPLVLPTYYVASVVASAICWTLAFCLYLSVFTPWLFAPRRDGKPG